MSRDEEWLDKELKKIFSKKGKKDKKEKRNKIPVMDEEEAINLFLEEMNPEEIKRDTIKALNRARYGVCLSMSVLEAVFEFLDVSDKGKEQIRLACLKDAGKAMERLYRIKMSRI